MCEMIILLVIKAHTLASKSGEPGRGISLRHLNVLVKSAPVSCIVLNNPSMSSLKTMSESMMKQSCTNLPKDR